MADKKISALGASTTPLAGTEVLPIVQSSATVQVSVANLTAGRAVAGSSFTASGNVRGANVWSIAGSGTNGFTVGDFGSDAGTFSIAAVSGRTLRFTNDFAGVEDAQFDLNGNFKASRGNVVIGTAGKGIDFSANTNAAGMTSELLNWYETGTWTGGISFGGGSTGITYVNRVGYYTRIGNIVTVSCYLVLSNKGSSTGTARITGLPFTCVNNASGYSALSVLPLNVTFAGQLSGYANINDTTIDLVQSTGINLTDVGLANNSVFIISLTYRAA